MNYKILVGLRELAQTHCGEKKIIFFLKKNFISEDRNFRKESDGLFYWTNGLWINGLGAFFLCELQLIFESLFVGKVGLGFSQVF